MQDIKLKALGMEGVGQEPTTVDEFDGIAKKTGSCLDRANQYIRYHVTLGDVRELFLHGQEAEAASDGKAAVEAIEGVDKQSGIERKSKPVLDKEKKPVVKDGVAVTEWDETEGEYFKRVIATLVDEKKFTSAEDARKSFQPLFDQCIKTVGFPAFATEHKAHGPVKLPAKYKIFAAKKLATGTVDSIMAQITAAINKSFTPAPAPTDGTQPKMYVGKYPEKSADGTTTTEVDFSVVDADAETLGKLVQEYQTWKTNQDLSA